MEAVEGWGVVEVHFNESRSLYGVYFRRAYDLLAVRLREIKEGDTTRKVGVKTQVNGGEYPANACAASSAMRV